MNDEIDLWGDDFDIDGLIPPVTILREQAAVLNKKTKQMVLAQIDTRHYGATVVNIFNLVAPALESVS
jgi:hypothetical protein